MLCGEEEQKWPLILLDFLSRVSGLVTDEKALIPDKGTIRERKDNG